MVLAHNLEFQPREGSKGSSTFGLSYFFLVAPDLVLGPAAGPTKNAFNKRSFESLNRWIINEKELPMMMVFFSKLKRASSFLFPPIWCS